MSASDPACLQLAGRGFVFQSADGASLQLPPFFGQFSREIEANPVAARYTIQPPDHPPLLLDEPCEWTWRTDTWRMGQTPAGDFVLAIHVLPNETPLTVARFNADFSRGDLLRRAGRHGAPTPYAFNYPCDQVAVLNALAPHGVAIVHAGAVCMDGAGLLFCGKSGAGKTTLSRLCRSAGALLLNDDRQFIWVESGQPWLAPTPWHGSEPEVNNRRVPLRAIFHLEQAPDNRATPIGGASAAARLLGNTVAPFYRADAMDHTLATMERITASVPSYHLAFTPSTDTVHLCSSVAASIG